MTTENNAAPSWLTEAAIIEAVTQWFPDRAYQAPFFARELLAAAPKAAEQAPVADAARGDAIARSKRILALVDDYHERPTADNRTALRHALHDAFTAAPAQQAVAPSLNERALLAAASWANSDTPVAEALAYRTGFVAGVQQAVTLTDDARDEPELAEGMIDVPCALQFDPVHPQYGWLFIPHVDGQWVTAARLGDLSLRIIDHYRMRAALQSHRGD